MPPRRRRGSAAPHGRARIDRAGALSPGRCWTRCDRRRPRPRRRRWRTRGHPRARPRRSCPRDPRRPRSWCSRWCEEVEEVVVVVDELVVGLEVVVPAAAGTVSVTVVVSSSPQAASAVASASAAQQRGELDLHRGIPPGLLDGPYPAAAAANASAAASTGALDRGLVVGERDEPGLELGGRRVDAAVEQRPAEAPVGVEVTAAAPAKSRTGSAREERRHQARDRGDLHRRVAGRPRAARRRAGR